MSQSNLNELARKIMGSIWDPDKGLADKKECNVCYDPCHHYLMCQNNHSTCFKCVQKMLTWCVCSSDHCSGIGWQCAECRHQLAMKPKQLLALGFGSWKILDNISTYRGSGDDPAKDLIKWGLKQKVISIEHTDSDVEDFFDNIVDYFGRDLHTEHPLWFAFQLYLDMKKEQEQSEEDSPD